MVVYPETGPKRRQQKIHVIGSNRLQNELMAFFINGIKKLNCSISESINDISADVAGNSGATRLILYDCFGKQCDNSIISQLRTRFSKDYIALFNLKMSSGIEFHALRSGLNGILYENESLSMLINMIDAIFENVIWISRRGSPEYFSTKTHNFLIPKERMLGLTPREVEILSYIAMGYSNVKIAETTYTSTHTVKTHVYNIFKKIKVANRLEAARWMAEYLKW